MRNCCPTCAIPAAEGIPSFASRTAEGRASRGFITGTLARRASEGLKITDTFDPSLARRASFETDLPRLHRPHRRRADAVQQLLEVKRLEQAINHLNGQGRFVRTAA